MTISAAKYSRDITTAQAGLGLPIQSEKRFLLKSLLCHIEHQIPEIHQYFLQIDKEMHEHMLASAITGVEMTEHHSPNTIIHLQLPDANLRGPFSVKYDRVSLHDYFNITRIINENASDPRLTVDYDEWVNHHSNMEDFSRFLTQVLTYKFGRTFAKDGTILLDDGKHDVTPIEGVKGLVLIVPTAEEIADGWKHFRNIRNVQMGTLTYQEMTIQLRLVANNHLMIQDGEAIITLRLTRPLMEYNAMTGGEV